LINFENIFKKYKSKTNIQIKKYFKIFFTSIAKILMKYHFFYTLIKVITHHLIKIT